MWGLTGGQSWYLCVLAEGKTDLTEFKLLDFQRAVVAFDVLLEVRLELVERQTRTDGS
jgi:hypothetical protein